MSEGESKEQETKAKEPAAPPRLTLTRKLALLVLPLLLVWFYVFVRSQGPVRFDRGVELVEAVIPGGAAIGGTLPIDLRYRSAAALAPEEWIFLHIEAQGEHADRNCRIIADRPAPVGLTTQWAAGAVVTHHLDIAVPSSCKDADFRVLTGVWNTKDGDRLKLIDPPSLDDRLHLTDLEIGSEADPDKRTLSGSAIKRGARLALVQPFAKWGLGVLVAAFLAVVFSRRIGEKEDLDHKTLPRHLQLVALILPTALLICGILVVLEFVKDDAYISFRYAHNFVKGKGLVFNPGEKLEGYTNFLWTMLMVPFEALGWDLFQVCEWIGTALSIGVITAMMLVTIRLDQARKDLSFAWGAMWLASSTSWVVWAKSGLEQSLATFLPLASAALLFRVTEDAAVNEDRDVHRKALLSGVLMALGCMTRPDIHLIAAIVGVPLLVEAIRLRRIPKYALLWTAVILAIVVPFHLLRYRYYHSWLPNTFYVKTGKGSMIWRAGLDQLREMLDFNHLGYVLLFVPFAFATRKRLVPKLVALAISIAFMGYLVKVGVDEMQWYRLYLPALPFLLILAGLGLRNLLDALLDLFARKGNENARWLAAAMGWGVVLYAGSKNFQYTYKELHGFDGHGDLSGMYHPDLGKFITRHERPGGLVAFQDMGSTPYHAPDVNFLDFIGLTEGTVARARNAYGLHAFVATEGGAKKKYDADMRDYFWKRNPEWAILTVYPPRDQEGAIAARFDADPTPAAIGHAYHNNSYQFGIWADSKFHQNYVHVRTWQRSRGYYLSLFRRKDLWEQVPREVVLDAPPPNLGGAKANFERGIELLGSKIDGTVKGSGELPATLERHEVFINTWWKVPGAMEKDLTFFVHVVHPGFQAPLDHPPGDWMYPADRWRPGDIIEDRVLFQLPLTMRPGTYEVYLGIYRRSTGERLKIIDGPADGRMLVGTFEVKRLYPVIHQLIPPTVPEVMRKYPDRIPDHGRKEGQ
jgi:arabinofuranosyltransferase